MKAKLKTPAAEKPHHFFGSTARNWAVGQTRQEVLNMLAAESGSDLIRRSLQKVDGKARDGLYCWTCRVDAPESAHYNIANFQPQGVSFSDSKEFNIVSVKGYVTLIEREDALPVMPVSQVSEVGQ